ncbi:MAG: nitroreductase family protein [Actinomycetota bacterium]
MDVAEAVRTVLAVRKYQDRPLPDDVLRRIVEAGRLTASASNRQPWHFVVVTDREKLDAIADASRSGPYIRQAPVAIAVAIERASTFGVSDASRAIQSMVLVAWEAGVGSNWVGFGRMTAVQTLLEIPEEYDVLAVVPFGYPAEERRAGVKNRKPLSEIASLNRFGQPFG